MKNLSIKMEDKQEEAIKINKEIITIRMMQSQTINMDKVHQLLMKWKDNILKENH